MKKKGLADSPFFALPGTEIADKAQPVARPDDRVADMDDTKLPTTLPSQLPGNDGEAQDRSPGTVIPQHHDTAVTTEVDTAPDSAPGSAADVVAVVETVRRAVKQYGKEAATYRFTKAEKEALAAIVYHNRKEGLKTSENEITRIAVNYIVQEYETKGEQSLLARVLQALNA